MVRLNKVYGNLMVDLKATNAKLVRRAVRLTCSPPAPTRRRPARCWSSASFHVKVAIVALSKNISVDQARALLDTRARQRARSAGPLTRQA